MLLWEAINGLSEEELRFDQDAWANSLFYEKLDRDQYLLLF
jgi:hypothetical protein